MSTPRLNPEVKALRAVWRALAPLDYEMQRRLIEWLVARFLNWPGYRLPNPADASMRRIHEERTR
jgi:hypothetical protein